METLRAKLQEERSINSELRQGLDLVENEEIPEDVEVSIPTCDEGHEMEPMRGRVASYRGTPFCDRCLSDDLH